MRIILHAQDKQERKVSEISLPYQFEYPYPDLKLNTSPIMKTFELLLYDNDDDSFDYDVDEEAYETFAYNILDDEIIDMMEHDDFNDLYDQFKMPLTEYEYYKQHVLNFMEYWNGYDFVWGLC